MSDEPYTPIALGTEKNASMNWTGSWVGFRTGLVCWRRENLLPLLGFENQTVQPASLKWHNTGTKGEILKLRLRTLVFCLIGI